MDIGACEDCVNRDIGICTDHGSGANGTCRDHVVPVRIMLIGVLVYEGVMELGNWGYMYVGIFLLAGITRARIPEWTI